MLPHPEIRAALGKNPERRFRPLSRSFRASFLLRGYLCGCRQRAPPKDEEVSVVSLTDVDRHIHRRGLSTRQLELVTATIVEKIAEPISVSALSSVVGLSRSYFSHAFRRSVGWTPHAHVVRLRLERAMTLMLHTEAPLTEVAFAAGFADQSHFSRSFRRLTGVTPADWRKAHKRSSTNACGPVPLRPQYAGAAVPSLR
jgi:AraC-like DNA-binding protein